MWAQESASPTCLATNHRETVINGKTGRGEDRDNWQVTCRIRVGEKVIYEEKLVLPYPTSYDEMMTAIREWLAKKAPQIIAQKAAKKDK